MPRYFFNIRGHATFDRDDEGWEFPDHATAIRGGEAAAKDMVMEAVYGDGAIDSLQIEVIAADGELIAVVPLKSVIRV